LGSAGIKAAREHVGEIDGRGAATSYSTLIFTPVELAKGVRLLSLLEI